MMKRYTYSTNRLEELYGLPKDFLRSDVVIVDNEIQNDISENWNYMEAKICVTGILFQNKIEIIVAEEEDDTEFKEFVKKRLKDLSSHKMFAFNKYMEIGNFKGDLKIDVEIDEIKPFNGKGWNKDRFFKVLQDKSIVPKFNVQDPFKGDACLCIEKWDYYLTYNDDQYLKQIMLHNMNCLIKETMILKNKDYFKRNYSVNDRNWIIE